MGSFKMVILDVEEYEEAQKAVDANPKKLGATPMDRRHETGQPIIFDIILDISGSMGLLLDELVKCFNEIMLPSLQEASKRFKGPMRVGCMLFSEKMVPAWRGYKSLGELDKNPLKREMLDQPGLNGLTALYGAMRAGVLWTAASMEQMYKTGRGEVPKGKIIVLSDGANNIAPNEPSAVTNALVSIGEKNRKNIQRMIGFFNTSDGLTEPQFNALAKTTDFYGLGFYKIAKGENVDEMRASFRHKFKIFSSRAAEL